MKNKITRKEVVEAWGTSLATTYLVELLNGDYKLEDLIDDILSFREDDDLGVR